MPVIDVESIKKLYRQGKLEEALERCREYLAEDPHQANVLHEMALLYVQMGELEKAYVHLSQAVAIEPQTPLFYNSLGNVLVKQNKLFEALTHFKKALALNPESPVLCNNLARTYYLQENFEQSSDYYKKAIALKEDYTDALFNFSILLIRLNQQNKAIEKLNATLQHNPYHSPAASQLGQLYLEKKEFEKAKYFFLKCLSINPEHVESHHGLGLIELSEKNLEKAIAYFEKTLELDFYHPEARYHLATAYIEKKDQPKALQYYMQQLEVKPDIDVYYNVGVLLSYQERLQESLPYFNAVLSIDKNHLNTHLNLGAIYLKLDDYSNAIIHYQAAQQIVPQDPEINYILTAITGAGTPDRPPSEYIQDLFDQYAPHYDQHLKNYLHYQLPNLFYKTLKENVDVPDTLQWKIIDLGCGTGLCGEKLKEWAKELVGIDLSQQMLAAAFHKNIYDRLENKDIHEALLTESPAHLIVAADVFTYLGDLSSILACCSQALMNQGYLLFSVEKAHEGPYILQKNMRYAHQKDYIKKLSKDFKFNILLAEEIILRNQNNSGVKGYQFLLQRT